MDSILNLLSSSNFIVINRYLLQKLGLNETLLLGELASEYNYWINRNELEEGYFYSTIENIQTNTTLTRYQQKQALEKLSKMNLVEVKLQGMPAKRYIKINEDEVVKIFNNKFAKNLQTSLLKTSKQDGKKLALNNNIIKKNKEKEIKNKYGEYNNVLLTDNEFNKLKDSYSNYNDLITYLDEYIEMKGYKAKSHYLCIKKWVVDAVNEKSKKVKNNKTNWNQFYINK